MLDAEEYLHLAIHASVVEDRHACLKYLSEVLQQEPENPRAIYLRAIQHAALGLLNRAIEGLQDLVVQHPNFETARLHLGLLLIDCSFVEEARSHFAVLAADAENEEIRLYSSALVAYSEGNFASARERLALGLEKSQTNAPLAAAMRGLLTHLSQEQQNVPEATQSSADDRSEQPVFLGAYGDATS